MPDLHDLNDEDFLKDLVKQPVITNPDSESTLASCKLLAAVRIWVLGEPFDCQHDPLHGFAFDPPVTYWTTGFISQTLPESFIWLHRGMKITGAVGSDERPAVASSSLEN
jgi:hypothetical protein